MTYVILKEAVIRNFGWSDPEVGVDAENVRAMQSINNSLTINLKDGISVGLCNSDPANIFKRVASALGSENAKEVKVSVITYAQDFRGVLKTKATTTLDKLAQ